MLGIGERKARRLARELKAKRLARIERVKRYLEGKFDRLYAKYNPQADLDTQWVIYRQLIDLDTAYRKLESVETWIKDN